MKRFFNLLTSLILVVALTSCSGSVSELFCSHEYSEWSVVKEATCVELGTENRKCNSCGKTEEKTIPVKLEHTYGEWEVIIEATCTEEGEKEQKCNVCQKTQTEKISVAEHAWKNATCITPKVCKDCGETEGSELGHSWNSATCEYPKVCKKCGKTEGSELGHSWKDATCTTPKTCTTCGEETGPVLDHDEKNQGKCSMCGRDTFLEKIQDELKVELIVPSVGMLNYYCEMKVSNGTGYDVVLKSNFVGINDRLFTLPQGEDYVLKSGRYVVGTFYRGIVDVYNERHRDTYLDNMSEAHYVFEINKKRVFVRFGVNGSICWGYSLADIGIY